MSGDWSAQYWAEKSRANRLSSTVDEWVVYARRLERTIAEKDKVIASYKAGIATRDAELSRRGAQISELLDQLVAARTQLITERSELKAADPILAKKLDDARDEAAGEKARVAQETALADQQFLQEARKKYNL
jgi:uncharacterized coiled-coil protein SlyX